MWGEGASPSDASEALPHHGQDDSSAAERSPARQGHAIGNRALRSPMAMSHVAHSSWVVIPTRTSGGASFGCDASGHGNPAGARTEAENEPGITLQHPLKFVKNQRTIRRCANVTMDDDATPLGMSHKSNNPAMMEKLGSWGVASVDSRGIRGNLDAARGFQDRVVQLLRQCSDRVRASLVSHTSPEASLHTRSTLVDSSGRSRGSAAERFTTSIRNVIGDHEEKIEVEGDDDDSASHMYSAMTVMVFNCIAVFFDFCVLMHHIFTTGEWLCFHTPGKETAWLPVVPGLNLVNFNLLCTMLALTSFSLVLRVLSIPGYTKIRVMVDCCYAAVLVGGIGMLNLHIAVCNSTPANGGFKYDYQIVSRFHIILHVARVAFGIWSALTLRKHVIKLLRVAVSQNKRRFVDPVGGFDLDLAYICDRVIAMAIPTVHRAPYRNDISEVARFFSQKHYGHFRVINLCEEFEENGNGNYAPSYFFGFVRKIPMRDHNACPLHQLVRFCREASEYLNASKDNVLAVHCRGGKGRTGMFVSSLLLWTRTVPVATAAIAYFDRRRRDEAKADVPFQSCTSPSQIRYVKYIQYMVHKGCEGYDVLKAPPVIINNINIAKLPEAGGYPWFLDLVIEEGGNVIFNLANTSGMMAINHEDETVSIDTKGLVVCGDVAIRIYRFKMQVHMQDLRPVLGVQASSCHHGLNKGTQLCFIQYHTFFNKEDAFFFTDDVDKSISKKCFLRNFFIKVSSQSFTKLEEMERTVERPATLPPRSARRLWGDEQKESKEAIDNTQLRGHASGNLNPASHTTARKQNGKSQTFSGLAMGRMNSLGFLTAPDEAIGSSPRSGRNRFASFSGVPGLGGSGSLFRTRINSASTSPIETSTPRPLSEKHATPGALLRAASGSMRSALSSFKILGSANRRIPMSLFEKMDDENHGLRFASSASILRISILELCKDVKTFEPGDVVFDENELALDSKHDIFYIENGVGEWRWTQANPIIELGFTRTMCFTGSGDFYGVTQNLMGTSCARRLSRVLVATSAMSVRVMHLERQRGSCGAILRFQGLSDELSAMAWENIAHGQVSKAADLGLLLQRLILQTNPLEKRKDATLVQHLETNATLVEDMRIHLKLSPVDKLLYFCTAKVAAGFQFRSESHKRTKSTVCVLSSCLAFKTYSQLGMIGGFTCNQIQWPHVTSLTQDQLKLKITFHLVEESDFLPRSQPDDSDVDLTVRSGKTKSKSFSRLTSSQNSINALFQGNRPDRFHKQVELEIKCRTEDDASSLKSAIDRMILRTSYSRYRSNIKLYTETTRNFMDGYSSFGYVKKSELPSDYRVDSKEGSTCADAFLDIYSQTAITQRYNPGDVIVSLGCFQPNLYHVVSGRVIVTGPDEQPLKEVLEDDLFGEEVFACSSSPGSKFAYVAGSYTTCIILSRQRAQNWSDPLDRARLYRNLARYGSVRQIKRWDLSQHLSAHDDDDAADVGGDVHSSGRSLTAESSIHSLDASTPSRAASIQAQMDLLANEYPHASHPPPRHPWSLGQPQESMSSIPASTPSSGNISDMFRFPSSSTSNVVRMSSGFQSSNISATIDETEAGTLEGSAASAKLESQDPADSSIPCPISHGQLEMVPKMLMKAGLMKDRTNMAIALSTPLGFNRDVGPLAAPVPVDAQVHLSNDKGNVSEPAELDNVRQISELDVDGTTLHIPSAVEPVPSESFLPSDLRTDIQVAALPTVTEDIVAMKVGATMSPAWTFSPRPGGSC